jgi:toxin ParE1/3/4
MGRAQVTKRARTDIDAIWDYIAVDSPSAADRLVDRFTSLFERLARMPRLGERYPHAIPGIRFFTLGAYVVVYEELNVGIRVLCVSHSARDWQSLLDAIDGVG